MTDVARRSDPVLGRVLRGGVINMAGAVIGAGLNLALIVAITRAFSQEAAGLLFSATSVFLIAATVANLGAPDGLVYFIARMRVLGRSGGVPRLIGIAVTPAVLTACATAGVMAGFAEPMADMVGTDDAAVYLRLLAVFLPFAVLADTALAATRAHHDMVTTALVDKVGRPLAQVSLVVAIALSGSAGMLALAWAGPYLPAAILAWFWLGRIVRRAAPPEEGDGGGSPVSPAEFWSFSLPRAVAGVAQMGVQRGGVVLTALLGGLTGAAVFTAATRVMVVGQFGAQTVLSAAQPRFAEQMATGDHDGVRLLYGAGTSWLMCLTWPLYLTALIFAPEVMGLFGPDYAAGAYALMVVCAGQLTASLLGMGDLILTMTGRTGVNLLNNVLSLAVNVVGCVLLIPVAGATGAAAALVAAVLVRKGLPLWQLRSHVVLRPFGRPVLVAAGGCLLWFGVLPLLLDRLLGGGPVALVAAIALGTPGHLATVWACRRVLGLRH
ncbi:lipopolysaccharide biosynthesis protein [Nocardiopsis lambiniae]|uniref:Polysaccharide biosynthesis C-terminal domain-containing protein n=1 Tax=Nocardiopsis lambiniae TaxID=3075539 RepID=A0ABU2M8W9_9ACTN|nr:polysaccharide biosynthesis C-terminal domain-containing protein [Nocardiopsis sp. DSM 44743]MDT0329114.1 polysaccharide biosynthesis C-terminal domain-containing protein [Nocardiopsis sp. DSM 44743]